MTARVPLVVIIVALAASLALAAPANALPVRFSDPIPRTTGFSPAALTVGDFNGDGAPDLAVANQDFNANEHPDTISLLRGDGDGTFGRSDIPVGNSPRAVVAGQFNLVLPPQPGSDAHLDLAIANAADDDVSIRRGIGDGTFVGGGTFAAGDGPRAIAIGLFNPGLDRDLAVVNEHSEDVSILLGGAGTTFSAPTNFRVGGSPSAIVTGDFDDDGEADLAVANLATDNVSVLRGGAGGSFSAATSFAAGDGPRSIATGHFNRDGDLDLVVANENSDDVTVLLGRAGAGFSAPTRIAAGDAPRGVATGDFNRDGDPDLAVANTQSNNVSIMLGGDAGSFSAAVRFTAGAGAWAVAVHDIDGDEEHDIVVTNFVANSASALLNTTPPDTAFTSAPGGLTNDPTPTFAFSADEPGVTFACRVDAAAFAPCRAPFTSARLADGAHAFHVRATDPAGNTDRTPASRAFTIDTAPPDTRVDSGPPMLTGDATPAFGFSSSEPGARFACRIDGAPLSACATPFVSRTLADGAHTFEVASIDGAGNADRTPAAHRFASDATPPDTRIDSGPSGPRIGRKPTFAFSSSDAGSTFACRLDRAQFTPCGTPFTTTKLAPGRHTFEARATDPAGNVDASPARRSFTALRDLRLRLSHLWEAASSTRVLRLMVRDVPKRARVQVRCAGADCPFTSKTVKRDRRRRADATGLFRGQRLRPGTKLEIRLTGRHAVGKLVRLRIRSFAVPSEKRLCLRPGKGKPIKCGARPSA
jgi:FG-GAP-like repeat/Bacterial Ig-like domain/FG-GAP repeat